MSQLSKILSLKTGLLLITMLVTIPTQIHAEPKPQGPANLGPSSATTNISTKVQPSITNNVQTKTPAIVASSQQPVESVVNLLLKLNEKRVYVYKGDKIIAKYPVAIGKKNWETPVGEWQVMETIVNPGWTSFKNGSTIAPGPKNPLGERWIGFWTDGKDTIGFHGTPDVKSIGTAASHGCVRMLNQDVKALFPLVKVGTTVKVVSE